MNKKINNKGFSLLELIIAVAIMGVISAPLLRSFVLGVKANVTARNEMKASTVAQNLMESVKASNQISGVENLKEFFEKMGITTNEKLENDKYIYELTGVEVDHSNYDAKIIVDPEKYRSKNDISVPSIASLDPQTNAIFTRSYEQDQSNLDRTYRALYEEFIELHHLTSYTPSQYDLYNKYRSELFYNLNYSDYENESKALMYLRRLGLFKRDITVDIVKIDANRQTVHTNYVYWCEENSFIVERLDELSGEFQVYDSRAELIIPFLSYDNYGTDKHLKAVYLLYTPNYYWSDDDFYVGAQEAKDSITINNKDNLDVEVFIIKQEADMGNSSIYPLKEQTSCDAIYEVEMNVIESPDSGWNTNKDKHKAYLKLRTNLEDSFSSDGKFMRTDKPLTLTYGDGFNTPFQSYFRNKNEPSSDHTALKNVLTYNLIQRLVTEDRIFGVSIEVYKNGTVSNNNPDDILFKLEGSKVN